MTSFAKSLLGAVALLTLPALALAQTAAPQHSMPAINAGKVAIEAPWTRATPNGAQVGGGFMMLRNTGTDADRLVSGASPVSGRVEIHEMAIKDGVMVMRPLNDGLPLPPGGAVELKPGSYHIMFMELKQPFKEGDKVPLKLQFEKGGAVDLQLEVRGMGAKAGEQHKH